MSSEMAIGYARVSTRVQSHDMQIDALERAGCQKAFVETASGSHRDRPQLKAALEFARAGDVLVVWRLDRLARSMRQLIETVEDLERRGIGFRSLTEAIDTTTASGRLVFHIMGALGEFERNLIRERTKAGLDAARARGRLGGRPPALNEGDLRVVEALLRDPEITVQQAAARLGVSAATLYRYLPGGRSALLGAAGDAA